MTTCLKCGTDTIRELCATCNTTETIRTELEPHLDGNLANDLAEKIADLLQEMKGR